MNPEPRTLNPEPWTLKLGGSGQDAGAVTDGGARGGGACQHARPPGALSYAFDFRALCGANLVTRSHEVFLEGRACSKFRRYHVAPILHYDSRWRCSRRRSSPTCAPTRCPTSLFLFLKKRRVRSQLSLSLFKETSGLNYHVKVSV